MFQIDIIIFLIIGLVILIKGADLLVDGAVLIAEKLRISALVIGLTIVAFGTSAPELVVNIVSSLNPAASDIGMGNIIGSNISNIGLIIGIGALMFPLTVKPTTLNREVPLVILSSLVFIALVSDFILQSATNTLSRGDGVILLLFFVLFIYSLVNSVISQRKNNDGLKKEYETEYQKKPSVSWLKAILLLIIGLAGVIGGGKLVVDNGIEFARMMGISEILIGLTLIAIGTSLPELATTIVAAFKKKSDIAVGNIVGSNIFNTFFVLGINAVISPLHFQTIWYFDLLVMLLLSVMLLLLTKTGMKIHRREGVILLSIYLAYTTIIIIRG